MNTENSVFYDKGIQKMESLCSSESLATFHTPHRVISEKSAILITSFVKIFCFQKVFAFTGSFLFLGPNFRPAFKLHYAT